MDRSPRAPLAVAEAENRRVLLAQRVLGLGQHLDQGVLVERLGGRDHGEAADELRQEAVVPEVLRLHLIQHVRRLRVHEPLLGQLAVSALELRIEANATLGNAVLDDVV
eukprot:scaffold8102_cov277-Pinguiococcus_pyrenoidosus.AAC.2